MMMRSSLCALVAAAVVSHASGAWIYTVDISTARLCRVDTDTAAVEVVGPMTGFTGSVNDLEFLGNRLFGVASVSPNKRLIEIDPATGAILSSVVIRNNGTAINAAAEGLALDEKGTGLLIAFDDSGMFGGSNSSALGLLGLDGSITAIVNGNRDCDGLGRRLSGGMWGVDREPAADLLSLFTTVYDPYSNATMQAFTFDAIIDGVDEITETRTGLYALDYNTRNLHRFDRVTGAKVSSTAYSAAYLFIAAAAPPPCPGDADGDGDRDFADITKVLENFGVIGLPFGPGDSDGDGEVDFADITKILENWTIPCP